jgi:hypothetical protein
MNKLPLLVKGFFSNQDGTNDSIAPSAPGTITWNNVLPEGRGDLVAIDPILTNTPQGGLNAAAGEFNLSMGGINIIQNADASYYDSRSRPRAYSILPIRQRQGQTLSLNYGALDTRGLAIHAFFENQYDNEQMFALRRYAQLKQRIIDLKFSFPYVSRYEKSRSENVPTAVGDVVAVEFYAYSDGQFLAPEQVETATFSVAVDGVNIVEDACTQYFSFLTTRPAVIYPILIKSGSTIQLVADTSRYPLGSDLNINMRLYLGPNI